MSFHKIVLSLLLLVGSYAHGVAVIGNKDAPKGGTFTIGFAGYPKALLFYLGFDELSNGVNALILESLLDSDLQTYDPIPLLAQEVTESADHKTITFKLNPKAKFSDGKPVTTEDVKFTWDTIMNPKNKTAPLQAYFSSFEGLEVVDAQTVKFKVKRLHFNNLQKVGGLQILPKHFFSKGDFNKAFNNKLLGSGPYILEKAETGKRILLKRDPNYWGKDLPQNIGRYNFDKINFKAVPDYNVQFELFKKGDIDYFYFLIAKTWATETSSGPFEKGWVSKIKAENLLPYATQGVCWNMRKPLFQDRKVRTALSYLMNREKLIKDLFYDNYDAASGVVGRKSEFHSPKNEPIPYDPKKAKQLLEEAGWKTVGADGVLTKDGARFEFEILTDNPAGHRWLTVYQEDLKKMGIKMTIRTQDWATKLKLTDDWQFDATDIARGREIMPADFDVMWGSAQADIKGSSNTCGYKNPEVDELSKKIDETFDKAERVKLVRQLDEIIARDQPMSFAWEPKFLRLAHWNRYGFPGKGYFNYSYWWNAFHYWWVDKDKEAKLAKAVAEKKNL